VAAANPLAQIPSDRTLQTKFPDHVAGLPFQPLRSLRCFIFDAMRHVWPSGGRLPRMVRLHRP